MSAQGIKEVLKLEISARPSAKSEPVFRDRVLLRGDVHPSAWLCRSPSRSACLLLLLCIRNEMCLFPISNKAFLLYLEEGIRVWLFFFYSVCDPK